MPLIDRLERQFGWIAIPGIVRILAAFQGMVYILGKFNPGIYEWLLLIPPAVLRGEVWRVVSCALVIPPNTAIIYVVLMVFFLIFLGELLERAWGSFRLTLYVAGGILGLAAGSFFAFYVAGSEHYAEFSLGLDSLGSIGEGLLGMNKRGYFWGKMRVGRFSTSVHPLAML